MKKLMILLLYGLFVFSLTACNENDVRETTTTVLNVTDNSTEVETSNAEISSSSVFHTLPEEIFLNEALHNEEKTFLGYDPIYRVCYYKLGGFYSVLVENEIPGEFMREYVKNNPSGQEKEMVLKAYVKYYNIPKEKFEEAVQKQIPFCLENGMDISREEYEIPNPDIIYTFDDAIINDYYRRDKGVKPTEAQSSVTE